MLRKVEVNNFKSWQKLDLDLAPITGLFGPNSSGKSSLLQFLLMLKQTKELVDRSLTLSFGSDKTYTNLGSFHDVIFQHNDDLELDWNMRWSLAEELTIFDTSSPSNVLFNDSEMSVSASVGLRNKRLETRQLAYEFGGQTFSLTRRESKPSSYSLKTAGRNEAFQFRRTQGRAWDIPGGPIKSYAFPDQAQTYYQNTSLLSEFEIGYESLIDSIYYLGPLRDYPRREYTWSGARPADVGQRGERVVDALLAAKSSGEQRHLGKHRKYMEFDEFIAHWLKEMGLIDSFSVSELAEHSNIYKLQVRKDRLAPDVLITDVGFGVSQVLPVLVLLYYVPKGSIVLLEQPEIHLHPAVQSALADLIINAVETRGIQVVVESHSEHLLRRLQRRVAEEKIGSEDVALYFCSTGRGQSRMTALALNLFGHIENWPDKFFGDEFGEIAAIQKEALRRRNSGIS